MRFRVEPWHLRTAALLVVMAMCVVGAQEVIDHQAPWLSASAAGWLLKPLLLGAAILAASAIAFPIAERWRPATQPGSPALLRRKGAGVPQVLLAPADSVMMAGVGMLLAREPGLEILPVEPANGPALVREIQRRQPDVIIIDKEALLAEAGGLFQLLVECPGLRVVVLNPEHNTMQVYDRAQVGVKAIGDLLAVLQRAETSATSSRE